MEVVEGRQSKFKGEHKIQFLKNGIMSIIVIY